MKPYGFGIVGSDGVTVDFATPVEFEHVAKQVADDMNKNPEIFYSNRVPWKVVSLFYKEKEA